MANTRKATPAKTAARKAPAKRAAAKTEAKGAGHGFKVGDVVHFAKADPREDQRLTIMEVTDEEVIGANATGTRMSLNPSKLAKVED